MIIELIPTGGGPVHVKHDGEIMGLLRFIDEKFYYDDDRYGRKELDNVTVSEAKRLIAAFIDEQSKTINPYKDEES